MRYLKEAIGHWLTMILSIILLSPLIALTALIIGLVGKVCWYALKFGFNLF